MLSWYLHVFFNYGLYIFIFKGQVLFYVSAHMKLRKSSHCTQVLTCKHNHKYIAYECYDQYKSKLQT